MSDTANEYLLLVGNPGVGKSTILNGLVGKPSFKSGFSAGSGMTQHLQLHEHEGVVYGDTPGLADTQTREQAAAEIAEALRQEGNYRLVFVVTTEAGRARPSDIATIKVVLDAIDKDDVGYGIIVNKVSPAAMAALDEDDNKALLFASLAVSGSTTPFILLNAFEMDLFDTNDKVAPISANLALFLDRLPRTSIAPADVSDLKYDELEELRAQFEETIAELERSSAAREAALQRALDDLRRQKRKRSWLGSVLSFLPIPAAITNNL